jgi:nucleotide-binding universal stress UspA family protein
VAEALNSATNPGAARASAIEDFRRARRQAVLEEIFARLTGKSVDLLSYDEVRRKLKAVGESRQELKEIPLEAIVGSVGRYSDFTRGFLPRRNIDAERWAKVRVAVGGLVGVPPIEVYQISEAYFVRDGNHRVSVARELGATHIQAYVSKVRSKVDLPPDVEPDDLILKAEYTEFLEHTRLDETRPEADLNVTVPGQYQKLEEHIEVHRHFMGLEQQRYIPYEEAAAHWYDEVYLPVAYIIRRKGLLRDFPERTEADLYLWLAEHQAAMREALGWDIEREAAAADLASRFSARPQRVAARVGEKLLDAVMPDELEPGPPPGQWRQERVEGRPRERLFPDILVALSGDEPGWQALEQALVVARLEGSRLHGLHVRPAEDPDEGEIRALQDEFERRCAGAGVQGKLAVESGNIARLICERARWADLVTVSLSHPPGPQPIDKLRSGLRTMIGRCPRPVLVAPRTFSDLRAPLLAYDGSPKAEEALFVAAYIAGRWQVPLTVVTVAENGLTAQVQSRAREYLEAHGVEAAYVEQEGVVAEAILEAGEERGCDLVVMGGYGRGPVLEMVLGSTVDGLLRTIRQPVLICR